MLDYYRYNPIDPTNPDPTWPPQSPNPGQDPAAGCLVLGIGWFVALITCLIITLCTASSCTTTRYVPVETVRTDTLIQIQHHRDSIYIGSVLHDSVVEKQRGDTILIDRWHTRTLTEYRDRFLHDTTYIATHDTIPQIVEVPKEVKVERPLTWWQQTRLHLSNAILLALALAALIWLWQKRTWWLRLIGK